MTVSSAITPLHMLPSRRR